MKKKDLIIVAIVAALALGLLVVSQALPRESKQSNAGALPTHTAAAESPSPEPVTTAAPAPEASASPEATEEIAATEAPQSTASPEAAASPIPTLMPAKAYLKVQVGNLVFEPVPLTEARDIDLTQRDGKHNVVRVTTESIVMHSSNCDNQDCVHQGMVSLENRDKRVLQNMIICLPNQVVLELMDAQEAQADWEAAYGKPGA